MSHDDTTLDAEYAPTNDERGGWYFVKVDYIRNGQRARWLVRYGITKWLSRKVASGVTDTMAEGVEAARLALLAHEKEMKS